MTVSQMLIFGLLLSEGTAVGERSFLPLDCMFIFTMYSVSRPGLSRARTRALYVPLHGWPVEAPDVEYGGVLYSSTPAGQNPVLQYSGLRASGTPVLRPKEIWYSGL